MLHESGAGVCLGWYEQISEQEVAQSLQTLVNNAMKRAKMVEGGRQLVDGRGSERTLAAIGEKGYETGSNRQASGRS